MKPDFCSENAMDYVRVALAIETLAYYNMNYLDRTMCKDAKISEEIQALLSEAIKMSKKVG